MEHQDTGEQDLNKLLLKESLQVVDSLDKALEKKFEKLILLKLQKKERLNISVWKLSKNLELRRVKNWEKTKEKRVKVKVK